MSDDYPTHDELEQHMTNDIQWPQYYASGENVDAENFVPAYYKVEGPNGPAWYVNPSSDKPIPSTMYGFAMEAQADGFHWCSRDETPWPDIEADQ